MGNCVQPVSQVSDKSDKSIANHKDASETVASTFKYTENTCALEYWEPVRLIGEGSISTIHLVKRRPYRVEIPYKERADIMARARKAAEDSEETADETSDQQCLYALKSIMKDHVRNDRYLQEMRDEIYTMSNLHHPNIVRVIEAYERKRHVYLIMERCQGGDLCQVEGTTEQHAKAICRRILDAVAYMHDKGVVHRDLKMENIMFSTRHHKATEIKVIDFGLATKYLSNDYKKMTEKVGTIYTMAPQVMQGVYDNKCDLWSIGVITYILLSGSSPFYGPRTDMVWEKRKLVMIDRIMRGDYMRMEHGKWDNVSEEAKQFVKSLLQIDPKRRPSAKAALKSVWMKNKNDADTETPSHRLNAEQKRLRAIRLAALLVMENISTEELLKVQQILQRYDPEDTGSIEYADLRKALAETGKWDLSELDELLPTLEGDGKNSRIDHVDFIIKAVETRGRVETESFAETLEELDRNKTGTVSVKELRDRVCGLMPGECRKCCGVVPSEWTQELCSLGDKDGEVEIREVLTWFGKKSMHRMELLHEVDDEIDTSQDMPLATPSNASIPGGRFDPKSKPVFVYDEMSISMRRFDG